MSERIAFFHELIQTEPTDRLDCVTKTQEIKQVIMSCVVYLDQIYQQDIAWDYTDDDFKFIHEQVCVAAVPLLDMVERFLEQAEAEAEKYSFAV